MEMGNLKIQVPKAVLPLMEAESESILLERNALLFYSYIKNEKLSQAKVAEILGVNKLELKKLYNEMGLCIIESENEIDGFSSLRNKRVFDNSF